MGTWGPGIFDNDVANDTLWEVEEGGLAALSDAFRQVLDAGGRADAGAESAALAGATLVAAAFDGRSDLLPEEARPLLIELSGAITRDADLRHDARRVVHLVLTGDSELLELWRDSGESDAAIAAIVDVQKRLNGVSEDDSADQ